MTSNPMFAQSNGFVKAAVKIAKLSCLSSCSELLQSYTAARGPLFNGPPPKNYLEKSQCVSHYYKHINTIPQETNQATDKIRRLEDPCSKLNG